eukprot:ANDGO_01261.mRNA.1 cAMP-dependent protein kinase regulatory subunit
MASLESEYQSFLDDHQVPELITDLLVELCKHRPSNIPAFLISLLQQRLSSAPLTVSSSSSSTSASALASAPSGGSTSASNDTNAGDDDHTIDAVTSDMLRRRYSMATARRMGVSAEPISAPPSGSAGASGASSSSAGSGSQSADAQPKKDQATLDRLSLALRLNPLFKLLDENDRQRVYAAMVEKHAACGDVLIQQGDDGDFFYVLESGECNALKDGTAVANIKPGGSFGELALMYNTPRAASVVVISTDGAKLWAIDRNTYRSVLLGAQMAKRQSYEDVLAHVPILATLTSYERATVADALADVEFKRGDVVLREGESGDDFYIVIEGEVSVRKRGVEVTRLGRSEFFGEIALLTNQPRLATVIADSDIVRCARLDRAAFNRVLGPIEDLLRRNLDKYKQFVVNLGT